MSSEEETWEKLDAEFDHYVVDMKPFVLKLSHKTGNWKELYLYFIILKKSKSQTKLMCFFYLSLADYSTAYI